MPERKAYSYAAVRVVPRVERDEFLNVGVILFSPEWRFLAARLHFDEARLVALWPGLDTRTLRRHVETIPHICAGAHAGGPIARLTQKERFHWLTAPRSTVVQMSPVRSGLTFEPAETLEHLLRDLVL